MLQVLTEGAISTLPLYQPETLHLELSLTLVFILICVLLCKVALRFQERARRNQYVQKPPSTPASPTSHVCT